MSNGRSTIFADNYDTQLETPLYDLWHQWMGGWWGSNGLILRSTSGGLSWVNESLNEHNNLSFYFVHFTSPTIGIALGSGDSYYEPGFYVARTSDGGNSWTLQSSGLLNTMNHADRIDSTSLVTVGNSGLILQSQNSGASWSFPMGASTPTLYAVDYYDSLFGMAVGDLGAMVKTVDGGNTWQEILTGSATPLKSVQIVNDSVVVAGGTQSSYYNSNYAQSILYSSDAGGLWKNRARYAGSISRSVDIAVRACPIHPT